MLLRETKNTILIVTQRGVSQELASPVKSHSNVISQRQAVFSVTTLGKSPKNVYHSADLEICFISKFSRNHIIQKCNTPLQIQTAYVH